MMASSEKSVKRKAGRSAQRPAGNCTRRQDVPKGLGVAVACDPAADVFQKYHPETLAALAAEIPDIFPDRCIQKAASAVKRGEGFHAEASPELVDENIKAIAAYMREREEAWDDLPPLAREALRKFVTIRKYVPPEDMVRLEERIFAGLRRKFGPFNESGLVMFLVKYLL